MIGFAATFLGVGIGGVIVSFVHEYKRSLGTIYALCTGLILGLVSFSIVPEALHLGNWLVLTLGFFVGVIVFQVMHTMIELKVKKRAGMKTGLLLVLIMSFHNFPIGVILGEGEKSHLSQSLLQTLILHNIPEGMILFTFIFLQGFRFLPLVLFSFIVAIPVAIGAAIGEMIGVQSPYIWSFLISLTVGTIYMVTMKEILPESIKHSSRRYSLFMAAIAFFFIGGYLLSV